MGTKKVKIQNVLMRYDADPNFRSYQKLMHIGPDMAYDPDEKCHIIRQYTTQKFSTYFNCCQVRRWKNATFAKKFFLKLDIQGKGVVELFEIYRNSKNVNVATLLQKTVNAPERTTIEIEIPATKKALVGFSLTALEHLKVYSGCYMAEVEENNIQDVYISLVSTTFRKEDYIRKNIKTLKEDVLSSGSDMNGHIYVNIIDNGRTLDPEEINGPQVTVHPNANVGGSGGFTRGMMESLNLSRKPTHVLLMDDDVLIMSESLFRTYYLLRILRPEYSEYFISGAMFDYDQRQIQYEDVGYVHAADASYGPLKEHLDMTELSSLLDNEDMAERTMEHSYAGWWYCCIPTSLIEKNGLPLPLFVRGDDVEFSIRNNAKFLTLNGISIWHVGFAGKFNAAMELYQVHRNSLVIQAASGICQNINFISRMKTLFWKETTRFAYNNAAQILDALDDFMKGPEFLEHLDGEACIKSHSAQNDKLQPVRNFPPEYNIHNSSPYDYRRLSKFKKVLYVITINGHLVPNFLLHRWPKVISFDWFFVPGINFWRRSLIAVNANDDTACLREINRKRCFALISRYRKTMRNYKKHHTEVEQAYRNEFARMTSVEFWKGYLHL